MTYKHSLFTLKEICDLCYCLILDWVDMWLGCAKSKLEYTNISSNVNYTNNFFYINLKKKKSSQGLN